VEYQTEYPEQYEPTAADVNPSEPKTATAAPTLIAPVFNIVADAARSPFHAPSLTEKRLPVLAVSMTIHPTAAHCTM
jgi:hypothetical protein